MRFLPIPASARMWRCVAPSASVSGLALVLAACGGSDSTGADASEAGGAAVVAEPDTGEVDDAAPAAAPEPATGPGFVDLVGPDVVPAAEIETNVLPSVVVDDVTNGRKVNFRNLVPQDKPVLLWMYAPH
jgi:hypothetical protein